MTSEVEEQVTERVVRRPDPEDPDRMTERTRRFPRITLSQAAAVVGGVLFLVLGIVALARAGIEPGSVGGHTQVGWFHATGLMGILHMLLGAVLLAVAGSRPVASSVRAVSVVLVVAGLVLLIEPDAFHQWIGVHNNTGGLFLIAGGVGLAAGWMDEYLGLSV